MAQLYALMSTRTSDVVLRLHASLWSVAEIFWYAIHLCTLEENSIKLITSLHDVCVCSCNSLSYSLSIVSLMEDQLTSSTEQVASFVYSVAETCSNSIWNKRHTPRVYELL